MIFKGFFLIIFSFILEAKVPTYQSVVLNPKELPKPEEKVALPKIKVKGQLKFLSQNIGGAQMQFEGWSWPLQILPVCPMYKLCDLNVMDRIRKNVNKYKPDLIFFQEALSLEQVIEGSGDQAPLLNSDYEALCSPGGGKVLEICMAWRTDRAHLIKPCRSVEGPHSDGGALACVLKIDDLLIQVVNTHPSAWDEKDRTDTIKAMWSLLVDRKRFTIIGGDFNTFSGTYGFDESYPYPPEFKTIFGRHVKGYGVATPTDSFFGYLKKNKRSDWVESQSSSTIFFEHIDHVFTNFGEPPQNFSGLEMPCENWVCLGNEDGYEWGPADWTFWPSFGPKVDHLPILGVITWGD